MELGAPVAGAESPAAELKFPTGAARDEYMKTGKLSEPKTEAAAASKSSETSSSAPEKAESAPVSETGKETQEKKDTAATRLAEVLADLKAAGLSPSELKTFKREQAKETKVADPSPAKPEKKAEGEKYVPLDEAKWNAEHPNASYDDWTEAKAEHKAEFTARQTVAKVLADRDAADAKQKQESEATKIRTEQEQSWTKKVGDYKKTNPDYDPAPLMQKLVSAGVESGSLVDVWLSQSEVGPALLKHLAENPDVLAEIGKMNQLNASRKLTRIEITLEPAKEVTAPAKSKLSSAPDPASEVGGRGTAPTDEVEDAAKKGNTRAYIDAQNAREIAARRGK